MANSSAFLQNHILWFLFPSGAVLLSFTTDCSVWAATAPLSDFNSRKSNIVLDRMIFTGKNYFTPTKFCPARARVSYLLLHKTPIVQNPKIHIMCLIGLSLSWHAGLQPPAWFRILGKRLHFCDMLSGKLEPSLRLHGHLPLPWQEQPC